MSLSLNKSANLIKDKNYFFLIIFFYFLYILNLAFLFKSEIAPVYYKCYLLNFDGGFVRRGLFGEIITNLAFYFNFKISNIFFSIYFLVYTIFFYYFYKLTKNIKTNSIFYFFIFSPLNFIFLLVQLNYKIPGFLGQKEIFIITFFLYLIDLTSESKNRLKVFSIGIFGLTFLTFIYELTIFTYSFFILLYFLFLKKNKFKIKKSEIIISVILIFLIVGFHITSYGQYNFEIFFSNLKKYYGITTYLNDPACTYNWMNREIKSQIIILYNDFKISYILKYLIYSHPIIILGYIALKNFKYKITNQLFIFSIISLSSIFLITTDWGRWVHLIYLFTLFSFLKILNFEKNIFLNIYKKSFVANINKSIFGLIILIYCTIWTLKHTYWQNHLSFAVFKIIEYNLDSIRNF